MLSIDSPGLDGIILIMNIWSLLGISVALVSTFCIIMTEVFQEKRYYETYRWHACALLIAAGLILWFTGTKILGGRKNSPDQAANENTNRADDTDEEGKAPGRKMPFSVISAQYWGALLVIFGVIVVFIVPLSSARHAAARPSREPAAHTNSQPTLPPQTNESATAPPPEPPKFPEIELQGIIFKRGNPSVIINGRPFFNGDYIQEAKIVGIERGYVTLENRGQRHIVLWNR